MALRHRIRRPCSGAARRRWRLNSINLASRRLTSRAWRSRTPIPTISGMFPTTMLYVQKAEYEWPAANNEPRFKPGHPVTKLEGDRDVFGDGSVTILSTPGHTPGHQSLLVKLAHTGAVVLSGDAVHFKSNWDNRGVPALNFSKEQTLASIQKITDDVTKEKAQLWINHE